ncbi:hypothetical protein TAMA11512_17770 [Selenomonas sp. TAMA-11512]|nr:hypothetical protein TAMA11512_17770 [Selenomonas sp. TAMA-11512]
MDKQMVEVLNNIHFAERYQNLCKQHNFDFNERFVNHDINRVMDIILELGYQAKYFKGEKFFRSKNKLEYINLCTT